MGLHEDAGSQPTPVTELHRAAGADAEDMLLDALARGGPVAPPSPRRSAYNDRTAGFAVVHRLVFRDVVKDLIEAEGKDVTEHHLGNRPIASQRKAGRDARDRRLADWGRPDLARERSTEASRDFERTAVGIGDVLP